jgi:hypothetical protein
LPLSSFMNMWWLVSSECVNACVLRPRPCGGVRQAGQAGRQPGRQPGRRHCGGRAAAPPARGPPRGQQCGTQWGPLPCSAHHVGGPISHLWATATRVQTVGLLTWKYLPHTRHTYTLSGESDTLQHFSKSKSSVCARGAPRGRAGGHCNSARPLLRPAARPAGPASMEGGPRGASAALARHAARAETPSTTAALRVMATERRHCAQLQLGGARARPGAPGARLCPGRGTHGPS